MLIRVGICRPPRKGRGQLCYRLRWREPLVDEHGSPVFDENGKLRTKLCQETTKTKDRKTAERIAHQRFAELNHLTPPEETPEEVITLTELAEKDEQWLRNRQRSEGLIYLNRLALRYLVEIVGDTPISAIGPDQIESYIAARNEKVGPVAVNRELSNLRATFNRAVTFFKVLKQNPFKGLSKLDVPERPIKPLSDDEEKRLLDACAGDLELDVYVRLALDTGCRAGELSNLLWENLDLEEGTGMVECNSLWKSKTRRNRFIAFTAGTTARLKKWRLRRVGRRFVFREEDERERGHYDHIRKRFNTVVNRAKVIPRRTLHDIRRTVGTRLAVAGINQKVAAAFLGHRDIATTARFYQTVDDDVIRKAMLKIRGAG